jgi:gamma-butyrobetaine dioxygenase
MTAIVSEIIDLFARFGSGGYGEDLSLERHMLQSAAMARSLGARDSVVAAALLHDIGYFLHAEAATSIEEGRNIEHEALGAAWLSRGFGADVTAPIALHVEAKRYLCAVESDYYDQLSQASRLSLAVQGGIMSPDEAAAFARHPALEAALLLRRCDDLGKDVSMPTGTIEDYGDLLTAALRGTHAAKPQP